MRSYQAFITCIVPSCNRPHLLARCLKSLLNQSYTNYEILVVNDGDELQLENTEKLKILKNEGPKGAQGARNTGLKYAKGEFIYLLDDDDEALDFLHLLAPKLEKEKVWASNQFLQRGKKPFVAHTKSVLHVNDLLYENYATMGSFIFPKNALRFDEQLSACQDWDFAIQLAQKYKYFHVLNFPFFIKDESGHQRIGNNAQKKLAGHLALIEKYKYTLSKAATANHRYIYYNLFANFETQFSRKIKYLTKALIKAPELKKKLFIAAKIFALCTKIIK